MLLALRILGDLIDGPHKGCAKSLVHHSAAGFADGRQSMECPILRTALSKLAHQQTVRQHYQVHVPGLALAVAQLTVSHAQLLLAVPMKSLRACPTISIHVQHTLRFPAHAVADQDLTRACIPSMVPDDQDAYFVIYFGEVDRAGKVPLPFVATAKFFSILRCNGRRQFVRFDFLAAIPYLPIHLRVAHITACLAETVTLGMYIVEVLRTGKIAVPGEESRYVMLASPVDQLSKEHTVVFERFSLFFTLLPFLETSKLQGVMLATLTDVVDEKVVVSNLVAILGVVPEPPDIGNQLAFVIDQHVIDGDHTLVAIAGTGVALQDVQTFLVERLFIPNRVGEKPIEARLIRRVRKLAVDGRDVFLARHEQAGNVFGKVSSLRFARKYVGEVRQRLEHDLRKFDDRGHGHFLRELRAPSDTTSIGTKKERFFQHSMSHPQHIVEQAMLAPQNLVVATIAFPRGVLTPKIAKPQL
jgi:hypothetical protein